MQPKAEHALNGQTLGLFAPTTELGKLF